MEVVIEELKQQREENFKKLGQWQLQKHYYEHKIKCLTEAQEELCHRIFRMEQDYGR